MGLYRTGPVHIASDSMAFVKKANKLLASRRSARRSRPFGITKDGDLWEHFYTAALNKGFNSICIGWTKGHATEDDVQKGITTQLKRERNGHADHQADYGILYGFPEGMLELATYLQTQRTELKNLSFRLQKAILRVL